MKKTIRKSLSILLSLLMLLSVLPLSAFAEELHETAAQTEPAPEDDAAQDPDAEPRQGAMIAAEITVGNVKSTYAVDGTGKLVLVSEETIAKRGLFKAPKKADSTWAAFSDAALQAATTTMMRSAIGTTAIVTDENGHAEVIFGAIGFGSFKDADHNLICDDCGYCLNGCTDGKVKLYTEADIADKRSEGKLSFDKKSGVYTVNFTTPENQTSTFTCDNTGSSITFTTPLWFGTARMNVVDENEQFIPYTAVRKGADIQQTETTTTEPTTEKETEKQSEQTTEAPNYFIMDGADGMVAQGAEVPYELRCNGASERFETLYLDGEIVPAKCFEIRAGAATTTLVLSAGFMKSLDAGTHTLRVAFTDGSVETTLTVRDVFADAPVQNDSGTGAQEADTDEALKTEPTEQDANAQPADDASAQTVKSAVRESVVPNTGDEFSPSLWVTVLLLATGCALSVIVFGKRKAAYGSGR